MPDTEALSLLQLTKRISTALTQSTLTGVWVVAETSDLRIAGGHCYIELVEKEENTGRPVAKMRATIWASTYYPLAQKFMSQTGQQLRSDLKVMVRGSVNFHPVFGLSFNIIDINGAYTLGDVLQRRNRMIAQLKAEGILDLNRQLAWPLVPQRIAIISARGAAGYGDFIDQLYSNVSRLRFVSRLFPATMQGESTAPSIIAALEKIAVDPEGWDCVVIIRGGGATTDLLAFDNYDLAANIAQFPIPVIIGIGHERDITLLDYVANMRVKTPTAAAEWLVGKGEEQLGRLHNMASVMLQTVTDRLSGCHQQLAQINAILPLAANTAVQRARNALMDSRLVLQSVCDRRIVPETTKFDNYQAQLMQAIDFATERTRSKLDAAESLIKAYSPTATLRRGYSITRIGGKALRKASDIQPGEVIETVLADGILLSKAIINS